ncbi:hypothetical protein EJ05DRAFT_60594 [Pseudovirgaria hyperparasitica]|uniref:Aminoglycoside phosphotransferase domain-containing protein n=1 Tax=Pseudovirgaria hyperparasitica TaxID=470096 RepID=A0A6A6W3X0_9PEZI|nr:uncharacterized protein EJ05DRAFT_60594 [Pseudovirgaria hyperparasitica]KAF2757255.1 hypothetical protein EJ05DRAFT_60594 [Pseudovirgaria hyperparasitica]
MDEPIEQSVKQVSPNTWLIGSLVLHRSTCGSCLATWSDDGERSFALTEAPVPPPLTTSLPPDNPHIQLVYSAGVSSAVWSVGKKAFCKVKSIVSGTTPEAATIDFVRKKQPDFAMPEVLYHTEYHGRSYLFLSRVPGRTLADAWPTLNEAWRQYYVTAVTEICKEMQEWTADRLSGVDGRNIPEQYLVKSRTAKDYSPGSLEKGCRAMAMDCSSFVFYHADLGPGNIIVENDPNSGTVGIVDWETAGYFPRGWIRTKFRICSGMDLSSSTDNPVRWRSEVQRSLGANGFEDYSSAWQLWWQSTEFTGSMNVVAAMVENLE